MSQKSSWFLGNTFFAVLVYGWLVIDNREAGWVVLFAAVTQFLLGLISTEKMMNEIVRERSSKRMPLFMRIIVLALFLGTFLLFGKYIVASLFLSSFLIFDMKNKKAVAWFRAREIEVFE